MRKYTNVDARAFWARSYSSESQIYAEFSVSSEPQSPVASTVSTETYSFMEGSGRLDSYVDARIFGLLAIARGGIAGHRSFLWTAWRNIRSLRFLVTSIVKGTLN